MTSQFLTGFAPWIALALLGCSEGDTRGYTRLMRAAASGEAQGVRELLQQGSDPNAADASGNTALSLAAQFGRAEVIALLLEAKADVDLADREGVTPLMKAARFGQKEAVDALLQGGADPSRRDHSGRNAASWARSAGHEALGKRLGSP
jgi:ankyrin repeat protein